MSLWRSRHKDMKALNAKSSSIVVKKFRKTEIELRYSLQALSALVPSPCNDMICCVQTFSSSCIIFQSLIETLLKSLITCLWNKLIVRRKSFHRFPITQISWLGISWQSQQLLFVHSCSPYVAVESLSHFRRSKVFKCSQGVAKGSLIKLCPNLTSGLGLFLREEFRIGNN